MQLNDRMKPSDDELINRIKAGLQDYEEPYVDGTWENFNQGQESKKGSTFWIKTLSSAAAVLLVGFGLFIYLNNIVNKESVQIAKIKKSTQPAISDQVTDKQIAGHSTKVLIDEIEINVDLNTIQQEYNLADPNDNASTDKRALSLKAIESLSGVDLAPQVSFKPDTLQLSFGSRAIVMTTGKNKKDSANKNISFEDFLANETKSTSKATKEPAPANEDSRWDMGLVVSPSYNNTKKLTLGYGVSMAYALSDKLSLSSGISINQLASEKDFVQPEATTLLNGKILESAESNLTGVDIPFDVKYHFNKNVYANMGISAFAVLDESRKNTYVEARLVEHSFNTAEGKQETRTLVENQRTVEKVPDAGLKNSKYLGLYNFSFGFKQKVSKNTSLSIEPFVKVPVKENKKESLKLFATGLRLKLEI